MKRNEAVYLIYRFENNDEFLNLSSRYKVSYFFTATGEVTHEDIKKVQGEFSEEDELEFKTKDELTEFSYRFIETHNISSIYLLNTNDFNIGVESSNDLMSFRQVFSKYGLKIDLHKDSGGGIFNKFF
ncbi:MAG: hypothetical protein VYA54_09180 [Bdellovibrionota bacterium]|nr:hypothetical protein [Bdellovibrionota bacterium]